MRYCSACGNQYNGNICESCGTVQGQPCTACGQLVPVGNRFCGQCGARVESEPVAAAPPQELASTPASAEKQAPDEVTLGATLSERREVTVVFVDITNFTAASHKLDSEDVFLWMDEAMRLLVEVIHKYEGSIDKFTGDGLMALFGAPAAHENDPERAVRAALEMQNALKPLRERIRQKHGFDFQARIGVNTGLVIAGHVGNDLHKEYTVLGDTVNQASRLEKAAEPGTILVSFATYQRTRPLFRYQAMPLLNIKGVPQPIQSFRPLGVLETPGSVRGLPGIQVPMIGRAYPLALLQQALTQARRLQQSQLALVTGEAGLGKSRLVSELRRSLLHSDTRVYQGSCLAYTRSIPMWVVADLLRNLLHLSEIDPVEVQRTIVQAHLEERGLANDDIVRYLNHVLGLGHANPVDEQRLRQLDPIMVQRQTFAALRQLFLAEARISPIVLIFDDLHWVDPASRDFLDYLIQTIGELPVLLVLISRESERQTVISSLIKTAQKTPERLVDIQLQALSNAESQQLVDQVIPQDTPESQRLKRRIIERAGGIPFYIEELVRMLAEQGGLDGQPGSWEVTEHANTLFDEVPGTLKGLILTRCDRLPKHLRRTLQKAAVLGRSFPLALLQLLDETHSERMLEELEVLKERQFLLSEAFGAGQGYAFRHVLIQEAVYSTLLKRDRQQLHEQVGQLLEREVFWSPEEQTEVLAYHYAESTHPIKAVPFLLSAAENAARRCANETAILHYRRVIALLHDQSERQDDAYVSAQIGLGRALKFVGEFAESGQILTGVLDQFQRTANETGALHTLFVEGMRELADLRLREGAYEEASTHLQAGLDALGASSTRDRLWLWRSLMDRLAWLRFRQGNQEEALILARAATYDQDPEQADDPIILASLYNTLGGIFWQRGHLTEAIGYVSRSLELYKRMGYAWGEAIAETNLGVLYFARGMWINAAECLERSATLRQENGYLLEQAVNLNNLGLLRMAMGDHERAQQHFEASLAISRRQSNDYGILLALLGLSQLALIRSDVAHATEYLDAARGLLEVAGEDEAIQTRWLSALLQAQQGNLEAGLELAEQALETARAAGRIEGELDCCRVLGMLQTRAGFYKAAEMALRDSIALCTQQHDTYREGLALLELGRLYTQLATLGGPDRAVQQALAQSSLDSALQLFRTLGAAYDLELATAALSRLQEEVRPIQMLEYATFGTQMYT